MEHSSNKGIILILSILFIVVMMIPITGLIIAPSDIDWLEQPRYELGGMTLNEIFVDNAQYLETDQLITNDDFSDGTTEWENVGLVTFSVTGGILSILADTASDYFKSDRLSTVIGNKYYIATYIKSTSNLVRTLTIDGINIAHSGSGNYELISYMPTATDTTHVLGIVDTRASGWDTVYVYFIYAFNTSTLIANNQYSPLFDTTFDLMSDVDITTQMDFWVTEGLDTLNIWLTYNAVGLDHILSYDEMLDYYQLYLSYL